MKGPIRYGRARLERAHYGRRGYVYFIQSLTTGKIKIGFSSAPTSRLHALGLVHGDVTLLGTIQARQRLERELHEWFRPLVDDGSEWHRPGPELLSFIGTFGG